MDTDNKIYKSIQTIHEMLLDRNHDPEDIKELLKYQPGETNALEHSNNIFSINLPKINTTIIYVLSVKQRINDIKRFVEENDSDKGTSYILVVNEKLNATDQAKLNSYDFQIFNLNTLQYNISRHELVPKHELIKDQKEIQNIMEQYQLRLVNQFPYILRTDPMAKYLNAKVGNLMKITRISPSCGINIVYRYVL